MRTFYNESLDLIIKFRADDSFVLIGNRQDEMSDDDLVALHSGESVEGWQRTE